MKYETIIYEKSEGIATLTFNRPEVRNAANFKMVDEINAVVEEARHDEEVRVLILTGAGTAFHSGDDVNEIFMAQDREERLGKIKTGMMMGTYHESFFDEFPKPVIAAVNGPAIGSGFAFALSCDIRIASENAMFGYTYVRMGLIGTPLEPMILPHLMGVSRALEFMLSGEMMDAAEAEKVRLVSRVVAQEKLMDEARKVARKLMKAAPLSQQAVKRAVYKAMFDPHGYYENMLGVLWTLFDTEDYLEAIKAFSEKRPPQFKGR